MMTPRNTSRVLLREIHRIAWPCINSAYGTRPALVPQASKVSISLEAASVKSTNRFFSSSNHFQFLKILEANFNICYCLSNKFESSRIALSILYHGHSKRSWKSIIASSPTCSSRVSQVASVCTYQICSRRSSHEERLRLESF
jgi:hypothetical protein